MNIPSNISSVLSSLSNTQASSQAYAQTLDSGNITPSNVVGMSQDQTKYLTAVKILKIDNNMQKDVLNIMNPNLGQNVDMSV